MMARGLALVSVVVLLGCSGTEKPSKAASLVQSCREQYAASEGFGFQNDPGVGVQLAAAPADAADASVAQAESPSPLELAVAECQSGDTSTVDVGGGGVNAVVVPRPEPGSGCDPSQIMTHEAAECVARALGLTQGLEGLAAGLGYNSRYLRLVWAVKNTTERSSDAAGGLVMLFDAVTGELLATNQWTATS